ncbi:MAG: lamin tail domain-containing protein [Candidatus Liptonbacteria bacterium]|nr:lamin tail domain-containing protein [Candidatus Liptonbacteria bacterium]
MDEAESPRKNFWSRKKIAVVFIAGISVVAFFSAIYIYGFAPANILLGAQSLAAKTFRDIFDNGSRAQHIEAIDLADAVAPPFTDSAQQETSSADILKIIDIANIAKIFTKAKNSSSAFGTEKKKTSSPVLSPPTSTITASGTAEVKKDDTAMPACNFTTEAEPIHKVIFNEIAWMGSRPESGEALAHAGNREWMELRNNNGAFVDLSGWQILDRSGKLKITLDAGAHIDFGEFFLLEREDDGAVPGIAVDKIYSGTLPNSGGWLKLFDRNCRLIDEVDASSSWPGGDNSTKATLERDLMDLDWHTSGYPGGTPKAANSVVWKAPPTSPLPPASIASPPTTSFIVETSNSTSTGVQDLVSSSTSVTSTDPNKFSTSSIPGIANSPLHLVISAVQISGASSTNDFIKIFNPTAAAVDISGWKLRKRTSSGAEYSIRVLPAGSRVQAQNYFTWANSGNNFASSVAADVSSSETLAADNSVALENASGTIIDALAWGSGLTNPFVEGAAYPESPAANQILSRKFTGGAIQDTGDNAQDFEL